ncbi:MAG: CPBP family intramembrane glutamic endopeptidase [Bacteroidota bacterium]|jgi:hypothetical protein
MKKIWKYLQSYFKEEVKPAYFICVALLVAVGVYVEYTYDIEKNYVHIYYGNTPKYVLASAIMYGIPFVGSYLLYIVFYKRYDLLKNRGFLGLLFFALIVYSFRSGWFGYRIWVQNYTSPENFYYAQRTFNQIAQGLLIFIPVLFYWWFVSRKEMALYGFKIKGVDLKPYLWMLLFMIPLIAWASFQNDFLNMYPVYQRIIPEGFSTTMGVLKVLLFETCYGFDFVMTEFFFRGFLILAFAKYVGRGCVLPMVAFYVFIHFGKPLGETLSSFGGGLILGVIAYETKSIIGGIIAHLGVAWMMETGGTFGRELNLAE